MTEQENLLLKSISENSVRIDSEDISHTIARMKLVEHRTNIKENHNAYTEDLQGDRLVRTLIKHIRKNFPSVRFTEKKRLILKEMIILLFESQDNKPIFHIEGTELPLCWNKPYHWNYNYIRYEWGHLLSRNQNPDNLDNIQNLGLYSARCNQHIQTSMDIEELMVYGGSLEQRISNVLTKRKALFDTQDWKGLIAKLQL
jgi:hypothetical protein